MVKRVAAQDPGFAVYPQISGFWNWDIQRNLVFGDANLWNYFGLPHEELATGAPLARFIDRMVVEDRERVALAIQASVQKQTSFREFYRVHSHDRIRRILAVGRCYVDEDGTPSQFPGWFTDVTAPDQSVKNTLRVAALYLDQAYELVGSSQNEFLKFLLDNVRVELEARLREGAPRRDN